MPGVICAVQCEGDGLLVGLFKLTKNYCHVLHKERCNMFLMLSDFKKNCCLIIFILWCVLVMSTSPVKGHNVFCGVEIQKERKKERSTKSTLKSP